MRTGTGACPYKEKYNSVISAKLESSKTNAAQAAHYKDPSQ